MDDWNTILSFWDGLFSGAMLILGSVTYLANGPWKKSLNFIFPIKYGIPKSSKGWPLAK